MGKMRHSSCKGVPSHKVMPVDLSLHVIGCPTSTVSVTQSGKEEEFLLALMPIFIWKLPAQCNAEIEKYSLNVSCFMKSSLHVRLMSSGVFFYFLVNVKS